MPVPNLLSGSTIDVGIDGTVYAVGVELFTDPGSGVTYAGDRYLVRSRNAQKDSNIIRFDPAIKLDKPLGGEIVFQDAHVNPGGFLGQMWVATDHFPAPLSPCGNVYVAASVKPHGTSDPLDVHFIRSTNCGDSWSPPKRINRGDANDPDNNAYHWFATMSVAPNGRIDVVWNDTRHDPNPSNPTSSELYYSYSYDGGENWSKNEAVTPPFRHSEGYPASGPHENQHKLGDYYHMVSDNGGGNLAYAATFDVSGGPPNPPIYEENIYFVRVTPADCNLNGIADECDLSCVAPCNIQGCGTGKDCDHNNILDDCEQRGRCCRHDGKCEEIPEACCADVGDAFAPGEHCPTDMGTCCAVDGSCLVTSDACCSGQNGQFTSGGNMCTPPHACCTGDGVCIETTSECCTHGGGSNPGGGNPGACGLDGVCCLSDHKCLVTSEQCCSNAGGVPPGGTGNFEPGSVCGEVSACHIGTQCVQTTQACCDAVGTFDPDNDCGGCRIRPNSHFLAIGWAAGDPLAKVRANSRRHGLGEDGGSAATSRDAGSTENNGKLQNPVTPSSPATGATGVGIVGALQGDCSTPGGTIVTVNSGVLNIMGTDGIDSIRLALDQNPNPTFLEIFDPVGSTTPSCQVSLSDFTSIVLNSRDGDDLIAFDDRNGVVADLGPLTIDTGGGDDVLIGGTGNMSVQDVFVLLNTLQGARSLMIHVNTLVEMVGATENLGVGSDDMISKTLTLLKRTRTDFVLPAADFVRDFNDTLIQPVADDVIRVRDGLITDAAELIKSVNSVNPPTGLATDAKLFMDKADAILVQGAKDLVAKAKTLQGRAVALQQCAVAQGMFPTPTTPAALALKAQLKDYTSQIDVLLDQIDQSSGNPYCESNESLVEPPEGPDPCPQIEDLVDCMESFINDFERLAEQCEAGADVLACDAEKFSMPDLEMIGGDFERQAAALESKGDELVAAGDALVLKAEDFAAQLQDEIQVAAEALEDRGQFQFVQGGAAYQNDVTSQIGGKAAELENEAVQLMKDLQNIMDAAHAILDGGMQAAGSRGSATTCSGIHTTNTITGGPGPNVLLGTIGNDLIYGGGGDDLIIGGPGDDILYGDDGFDLIFGGSGTNEIHGGKGSDILVGGSGKDCIFGDDGLDLIIGLDGDDELDGGNYIDIILGGSGDDTIHGGEGIDLLIGDLAALGETGNDKIFGDNCFDVLIGGPGGDFMAGGKGQKVEIGGSFSIELGNVLLGGDGIDCMYGDNPPLGGSYDNCIPDDPSVRVNGIDVMLGGSGDDTMYGGNGGKLKISSFEFMLGNVMLGEGGNDTITSRDGIDVLFGGTGNDTITAGKGAELTLDNGNFKLELGDLLFGDEGNDTLYGDDPAAPLDQEDIDLLFGGAGDDIIHGYNGGMLTIGNFEIMIGNLSFGGDDNDMIDSADGIDLAFGGNGNDTIQCGKGYTFKNQSGTFTLAFGDFIFGGDGDDVLHGNTPASTTNPSDQNYPYDGDIDVIFGGPGADQIYGGGGGVVHDETLHVDFVFGDFIFGEGGADFIRGDIMLRGTNPQKLGIDFIVGGEDDDDIDAGPGSLINIESGTVVMNFGNIVFGSGGDDVIVGADDSTPYSFYSPFPAFASDLHGGIDLVFGGDGADKICTGDGIDLVFGNDGDDALDLGDGGAIYVAGATPPLIPFGNIAFGNDGYDKIRSGGRPDEIDLLFGNNCDDIIEAGGGFLNVVFGNIGDDEICTGAGLLDPARSFCPLGPLPNPTPTCTGGASFNLVFGNRGNDTIYTAGGGLSLLNVVFGNSGNDVIYGGDGLANIFFGNLGDDQIHGGDSDLDLIFGNEGNDEINGEGGLFNVLFGNDGVDHIIGGPADFNLVFGNSGPDLIEGGGDANVLFGNSGADQINAGGDVTVAFGNGENDTLVGGNGVNIFFGNSGDDHLKGGGGANLLFGNTGDDCIFGGEGPNLLFGGQDKDTLVGGNGLNVGFGGAGDDTLLGSTSTDVLFGNSGNDIVYGKGGDDLVCGNRGDDIVVSGGDGDDLVFGNKGNDNVYGDGGSDWVFGNRDNDNVYAGLDGVLDRVFGNRGDDVLYGCDPDRLYGGRGNDTKNKGSNYCTDAPPVPADCGPINIIDPCRPAKDGLSCDGGCAQMGNVCVPTLVESVSSCTFDGRVCTDDDDCRCGDTCALAWRVVECDCMGAGRCHVDVPSVELPPPPQPTCVDNCVSGTCVLSATGSGYRCDCPPTEPCRPTADALGCEPADCPQFGDLVLDCVPSLIEHVGRCTGGPNNGVACVSNTDCPSATCVFSSRVVECDCVGVPASVGNVLGLADSAAITGACAVTGDCTGCEQVTCTDPSDICRPTQMVHDPSTGQTTVIACDCVNTNECHLEIDPANGAQCVGICAEGEVCNLVDLGGVLFCDCVEDCHPRCVNYNPATQITSPDCSCAGANECHATVPNPGGGRPECISGCPSGETCAQTEVINTDGTIETCCLCAPPSPECEPLPDGSDCTQASCPDPNNICRPTERVFDPISGWIVTKCDCVNEKECYVQLSNTGPPVPSCPDRHCPGTNKPCELTFTQNVDHGVCTAGHCVGGLTPGGLCMTDADCPNKVTTTYDCCPPGCEPLPDGSACTQTVCSCECVGGTNPGTTCGPPCQNAVCTGGGTCQPAPAKQCKPTQIVVNSTTFPGQLTVTKCDCVDLQNDECYVDFHFGGTGPECLGSICPFTGEQCHLTATPGSGNATTYACCPKEEPDGWISDSPYFATACDTGREPDLFPNNPSSCSVNVPMWASDDIWVRNMQDTGIGISPPVGAVPPCVGLGGSITYEHEHQNQNPIAGVPNWVYVKLRSRGTTPVNGVIHVYWAVASTGLKWDFVSNNWDGTTILHPSASSFNPSAIPLGGEIPASASANVSTLAPCDEWVAEFMWIPPQVAAAALDGHNCLLARFVSTQDTMFLQETQFLNGTIGDNGNVRNNNNIAWRNITVVGNTSISSGDGFLVRNVKDVPANVDLVFNAAGGGGGVPFLDGGSVRVALTPEMFNDWQAAGGQGLGIIANPNDSSVSLTSPLARIQGIPMGAYEAQLVTMYFAPDDGSPPPTFQRFVVSQFSDGQTTPDGGVLFEFRFGEALIPTVSEWGLAVFALLLLIGAKIYFARSGAATAR